MALARRQLQPAEVQDRKLLKLSTGQLQGWAVLSGLLVIPQLQ
jgi:hypothetical protein